MFIGLEGEHLLTALKICANSALWAQNQVPTHSRGGVTEAWREVFTEELHEEFDRKFGDIVARLGYEE